MMATYTITGTDLVLNHGGLRPLLLRDLPANPDNWRVEALVASGDFCELLAVTLEQIAASLPTTSVEQYQLQDVIGNLLYVQRHYKLVKRNTKFYTRPHQNPGDNR